MLLCLHPIALSKTTMSTKINSSSFSSSSSYKDSSTNSTSSSQENYVFTAGLDDVTNMTKILHELHHADEHSVLVIKEDGIRLITAGEKVFQVSAYFAASTFQRFSFELEDFGQINFKFVLRDFIESLNLLRDDPVVEGDKILTEDGQPNDQMKTSLLIQYKGKGNPLRLILENKSNYVIESKLKAFTMPNDSFCPLAFSEFEETAIIVLNSKKLYDYVSGLDLVSSEFVYLIMGRGETPLKLITRSTLLGEVELAINQNESEIIRREIVVSDNCLFSFSYRSQFIKPALEALRSSTVMQMKCGSNGLLCIEHFHQPDDRWLRENDGLFRRPDYNCDRTSQQQAAIMDYIVDYNQPQNKRSSVEYFILSEAKPIDACPD